MSYDEFEFGDTEPDDAYSAEGDIAPEQVTYRLHELRQALSTLAGNTLPDWDELEPNEQQLALIIGMELVEQITADPDPLRLAHWTHDLQAIIDSRRGEWDTLDPDEQVVALALMSLIVEWLVHEGTLHV